MAYKKKQETMNKNNEFAKHRFLSEGCELISYYINNSTEVEYIARCGHNRKIKPKKFYLGQGRLCKECSRKNSKSTPIENVIKMIHENGCKFLNCEYKNAHSYISYIAQCGHKCTNKIYSFKQGHGRRCKSCIAKEILVEGHPLYEFRGERNSGKNHPQWNPNKTDEEREIGRLTGDNYIWKQSVKNRDNYICVKCGYSKGGILVSHHLDGWDNHPEIRYDLSNGVTLCEHCHKCFHMKYGYGNNTKEQYDEWIKENKEE